MRILGDVDLSAEMVRSAAGKAVRKTRIGTVYPATIGLLPAPGTLQRGQWFESTQGGRPRA
ncbi:hypothetical protein ASD02_23645 [Ensifer sp. Root1252]|nr:hypothetical protein ASD02_23645 [Ensifer sp. Root1252]KRC78027.1 hypothetical protein ASE32_28255 [Ensifer sp. Root231]KRD00448.1 hypothetical protein ASE47_24225 [Ensifer sp. Root258]